MTLTSPPQKVAIVTGPSQGIGAGIAAAFVRAGCAVVATSRSIQPSGEPDLLTVPGDIAEAETAGRVVGQALDRFGRIDTLINNVGIFIGKPFPLGSGVPDQGVGWPQPRARHRLAARGVRANALEHATLVTGETLRIDGGQAAGH